MAFRYDQALSALFRIHQEHNSLERVLRSRPIGLNVHRLPLANLPTIVTATEIRTKNALICHVDRRYFDICHTTYRRLPGRLIAVVPKSLLSKLFWQRLRTLPRI